MVTSTSNTWGKYTGHTLKWEGGKSSDPRDTAASCYPGGVHTNKGITFCTFKNLAYELGIRPVTYAKFLSLTDQEAGLFMYKYYQAIKGDQLPDSVALSMSAAAWGSGTSRAWQHLRDALNDLGQSVISNSQAIDKAKKVKELDLFNAYNQRRRIYLVQTLGSQPRYAPFVKGWTNRLDDFIKQFKPSGGIKLPWTIFLLSSLVFLK